MSIATIVLAAGGSTRLGGQAKQLLTHNGQTLVRHITRSVLALEAGPVVVVLGANEEQIRSELTHLPITLAVNPDWHTGMASSLQAGLSLLPVEATEAFLVVLTDQPHVTTNLLQQLITTLQQTGKGIVACQYGESGHLGVPALFAIRYKTGFMVLSGDVGARKLIQQHTDDCVAIPFPLAAVDLDTWQDVARWQGVDTDGQRAEGLGQEPKEKA